MDPKHSATTRPGLMIVVSAPSGGGKTSLCQRLLNWSSHLSYSVSCTTRPPRHGEVDGREYFFLSDGEFQRRIATGDFLEHAQYGGHRYGTPRAYAEEQLRSGRDVLLAIEVQGAAQVARRVRSGGFAWPEALVTIFLMPPTLAVLEQRLRRRGTDSETSIRRRLAAAEKEMGHWRDYDYVIVSGSLDADLEQAKCIVIAEKCRAARLPPEGIPWQQNVLSF